MNLQSPASWHREDRLSSAHFFVCQSASGSLGRAGNPVHAGSNHPACLKILQMHRYLFRKKADLPPPDDQPSVDTVFGFCEPAYQNQ
uniref:YvrJ protein n=1 Tax=Bacillus subtilis TaxID=1423 RepID=O52859_BACIU|nr:YvrJ protein [Bacillus subtilis] [Bacillus subtilis subsp. subtilis str. 168]